MTFEHPEYFIPLFILFIALAVWAQRKRQYVSVSSHEQMVRSSLISRLVIYIPFAGWLVITCLLLLAFANPQSSTLTSYITVLSKNAMVSVDASQSMGMGIRFSTMEKIRTMLHDFAERRLKKGDYLGISAYGGHEGSYKRGTGYSRVIQYPSQDPEVIHAAIDAIRPTMFGSFTAIGDGILVSILALIEPQARKALGNRYNARRLEDNLWSIGTGDEDVSYAQEIIRAVGRQKGRYVVLFTDGLYNAGLHPARALWFAERLGLKVHFIAFESAGATGLSPEEARKHKEEIIKAVASTGGIYRESADIEGVEQLFREIDQAEKTEITVGEDLKKKSLRKEFIYGAALAYCIWLLSWTVWGDPL